ncbi:Methyl farnesoate epoxidase [Frankliniella fusca]|uniref:Methyl farnesoate epoxidase n=1 Tax=Frankliniella fusca TaxID=407009 RepID=A0AAE1LPK2_9NEOP|nr:Methyl farnesoate epoxidase [Frankliniella fusca]
MLFLSVLLENLAYGVGIMAGRPRPLSEEAKELLDFHITGKRHGYAMSLGTHAQRQALADQRTPKNDTPLIAALERSPWGAREKLYAILWLGPAPATTKIWLCHRPATARRAAKRIPVVPVPVTGDERLGPERELPLSSGLTHGSTGGRRSLSVSSVRASRTQRHQRPGSARLRQPRRRRPAAMERERERRSPSWPIAPALLAVFAIAFLENAGGVAGTLYEGSPCFHEEGQLRGVCKLLPFCSWAVKERRSGLYPQTCSFDGYMPIVCCPYTRTHDPPHLPLRPHRPFAVADIPALVAGMTPSSAQPPPEVEESPGALETSGPPEQQEQQQLEGQQEEGQQEEGQQQQEGEQQAGTHEYSGTGQPEAGVSGILGPLKVKPTSLPSEPDNLKEEVGAVSALDRLDTSTDASSTSTSALQEQATESNIQLGDGSPAFAHGRYDRAALLVARLSVQSDRWTLWSCSELLLSTARMAVLLVLLSLIALLAAVVLLLHWRQQRRLKNFPPGPPRWPLVGSLPYTPGQLIHLHAHEHWLPKYGPLVGLAIGSRQMVVVCGPEESLAVLNHEKCQTRPKGNAFHERSFGRRLGIMFSDGPYWTAQRRFALRELRDLGLGKTKLEGVVMDEVDATLEAMERDGPELWPNKLFNSPVLNVLWWMVSGKPFARGAGSALDPQSQRLLDIMNRVMRNKRLGTAPCDIWPYLKYIAPEWSAYNEIYPPLFDMHAYIREEIKNQRQHGAGESFIGRYTEEINKAQPGSFFDEEGLIVTVLDLFSAGGESTANTLSFCLMYMAMYPDVQAKVHAELDAVCSGADKAVTMSDKAKLPYVEATLMEVMRSNTIAPLAIPHEASEDIEMNGYTIPKKTMLLISIWAVLKDKKHWGDPEAFRPERFIDSQGNFKKDPWLVPFGIGKRVCIGEGLAMQTAFLFFANIMNRFKFTLPPGSPPPSTIPEAGFTVAPQPFSVIAKHRTS